MNTAAIILAAGESQRLVSLGVKPFLQIGEKSFLAIIAEKVKAAGFEPIIVVTNKKLLSKILALNLPIDVVLNPHPEQGMIFSLTCGLNRLDRDTSGFLLHPVDFPLVKIQTYQKLMDSHRREMDYIIKPMCKGRSGHPVIFPGVVFEDLKNTPPNEGARFILKQKSHLVREIAINDPGILLNINTPEMYFRYCG